MASALRQESVPGGWRAWWQWDKRARGIPGFRFFDTNTLSTHVSVTTPPTVGVGGLQTSARQTRRRSRPRYAWGRPPGGRSRLGRRWGQRRAQIVLAVAGFNPARGVSAGRARGRPHRRVDPTPRSQLRAWGQRRRARGRPHRRVDPTPRSQLYRLGSTRGRRSQPRVPALVKCAVSCLLKSI